MDVSYEILKNETLQQARSLLTLREWERLQSKQLSGIAAFHDRRVVGIALFQMGARGMVADNLFVQPGYRLMGVGKGLLRALCALADRQRVPMLFAFEAQGMWDGFYRFVASARLFTIRKQEGGTVVLRENELEEIRSKLPAVRAGQLFFQQGRLIREEFLSHLESSYPEIVWELRTQQQEYEPRLCSCIVSEGKIQAVCLVKEFEQERELKLLYSRPGKGMTAAKVLMHSLTQLEQCPPKPVRFSPVGEAATRLMKSICPVYHTAGKIYIAYYTGSVT